MTRMMLLLFGLLLTIPAFAKEKGNEKEVKSTIKRVTVFTKGAQVSREAKTNIPAGNSILKFIEIAPSINTNSIQVKADGDFTILSVTSQLNYYETPIKKEEIEKLQTEQEKLQDQIDDENTLSKVLDEEESLILSNRILGFEQNGVQIDQLRATSEFYRSRLKEIRLEKLTLRRKVKSLQKKISEIQAQIKELNKTEKKNTVQILVAVNAKKATSGLFTISYMVNNAGWTPIYDLRVKDVKSPVQLAYKSNVYQSSGESWEDVLLTLSTGNPYRSGTKPILNPWLLNFYTPYAYQNRGRYKPGVYSGTNNANVRRISGVVMDEYGEPLIGANVIIKGTSIGTSTDFDGRYSLEVPQNGKRIVISYLGYKSLETAINSSSMNIVLGDAGASLSEVTITAKSSGITKKRRKRKDEPMAATQPVPVEEKEQATTISFKIDIPYNVPSDGKRYIVNIKEEQLPAYYEYYCAPKLDTDAFLTAQVTGWEALNLLDGEASLFFEGTYLGKSYLSVQSVEDTLDLSLGRDNSIVVKRTRQKLNTKNKFLSNKRVDTRAWDIEVRNKKKLPINIIIEDQIPVAITEEIEVEYETKEAKYDKDKGMLSWKFELAPSSSKKLNFKYTVKYPKKKQIQLE